MSQTDWTLIKKSCSACSHPPIPLCCEGNVFSAAGTRWRFLQPRGLPLKVWLEGTCLGCSNLSIYPATTNWSFLTLNSKRAPPPCSEFFPLSFSLLEAVSLLRSDPKSSHILSVCCMTHSIVTNGWFFILFFLLLMSERVIEFQVSEGKG